MDTLETSGCRYWYCCVALRPRIRWGLDFIGLPPVADLLEITLMHAHRTDMGVPRT